MLAVLIYAGAGLAIAWLTDQDRWWQRILTIFIWPAVVLWAASIQAVEWWQANGWHYETDEEAARRADPDDELDEMGG